jgi:hypothetical protein
MQIISLNNHIVRKALCLSLNEMAVLCDIKQMSQEQKYGYTCIKSKDKIAEWLDLSRSTVFTILETLIKKGYIEKNEIGLKPTSFIYQLDMCQEDIGLWLKNGGVELVTKKIQDILTPCTDRPESGLSPSRNWTQVYNIDNNNNIYTEKPASDSIPINQGTDKPEEHKEGGGGGPAAIDYRGLDESVKLWLQYKKEKKQTYKGASSINSMVNKLWNYSKGNPEKAMEIVQASMAMNYTGFFEPKENNQSTPVQPAKANSNIKFNIK